MTIDTEGSELALILDFPWDEFDVRIVQVEQLNERKYPAQRNRKAEIIQHMESKGYKLLSVYAVATYDTDDLIFTRNLDAFLAMVPANQDRDGDYTTRPISKYMGQLDERDKQLLRSIQERPFDPNDVMQLRKFQAIEALKARKRDENP